MTKLEPMLINVIALLEEKVLSTRNAEKLNMLLNKYQSALTELQQSGAVKTNLLGGCRAYLDSYGDYLNNPLLDAMYEVEKEVRLQFQQERFPSK